MAEASTLARPYAKAVFELAREQGTLAPWAGLLEGLALAAAGEGFQRALASPHVDSGQLAGAMTEAARAGTGEHGVNFLRLLAENRRLGVLPEITHLFEQMRAEAEGTLDVQVTAAAELSDAHRQQLIASLRQRLGREVRLEVTVDPTLIGGAVIRAGDMVIDASMRGRLEKLASALTA